MPKSNRTTLKGLLEENEYFADGKEEVLELSLNKIQSNPYQPRYVFDSAKIDELAKSIKEHGVFQPIIVKKVGNVYNIVSGERRYKACLKLGMDTIPAIVRNYEKDKVIEIALVENLQRENLTPVEEAKAYRQIMRELDYTQAELGKKVGKSRPYITNILGLLNLPDDVLDLVDQGKISMGHARVLSKLSDLNKIRAIAKLIVDKGLSVRQVEELASEEKKNKEIKKKPRSTEYKSYEQSFKKKYKGTLKVNENKITINLKDKDLVKSILDILCK